MLAETLGRWLMLLACLAIFFASMAPDGVLTRRQWAQVMLGGGVLCGLAMLLLTR